MINASYLEFSSNGLWGLNIEFFFDELKQGLQFFNIYTLYRLKQLQLVFTFIIVYESF